MKIIIWILVFFLASAANTILNGLGIGYYLASLISPNDLNKLAIISGLFSGLFVAAIYTLAYFLARKLCRQWDSKKSTFRTSSPKPYSRWKLIRVSLSNFRFDLSNLNWKMILLPVIAVILTASIGLAIYIVSDNSNIDVPPAKPPKSTAADDRTGEELIERAAYILAYYDARIDGLSKDLPFKASYFTPIDIDSLYESNRAQDRYLLTKYKEQGYLDENKYGSSAGKQTGDKLITWVTDFKLKLEDFRSYAGDYEALSKEDARRFFVDMELWCQESQEAANSISSYVDFYDVVWDSAWCSRIHEVLEELLKVQNEMLAISEEIYKAKQ